MDSAAVTSLSGPNITCLFQPTSPSCSRVLEISGFSADASASNRWIASLRNSQQPSFSAKQLWQSTGNLMVDPQRRRSLSVSPFERRQDHRLLRQLAVESSNRIRSLALREKTAAAERWHYIRSVLERRRERNRYLRQHFIRQPLESIMEARAKMPAIRPLTPQKSILKNKAEEKMEMTPTAPSVALCVDGDLAKSTLWMEAASALKLADQWTRKRGCKVRFSQEEADDWPADELDANAVKLPALACAAQWPTEAEKPQVGHQSGTDRLPSLSNGLVGVDDLPTNDEKAKATAREDCDGKEGAITSKGPSWAERQVAKVKQRKLWSMSPTATSSSLATQPEEGAAKIKGLRPCHPSGRLLRRTASMIVQMSDEGDNSSSSSSCSSQSPSPGFAEVETVPALLLNDCSPSATDGGSMAGQHSPEKRELTAAETVAWDIPLEKQSIARAERNGGAEQEAAQAEEAKEEEGPRQYRGWPQFPESLARKMSQRLERLKARTRIRLDKGQSLPKSHRMKRTPRWIKGKRPAAKKRQDPVEAKRPAGPATRDGDQDTEAGKAIKEARNWHLQSEDQRCEDVKEEASGRSESPMHAEHLHSDNDELLPWMAHVGCSKRPQSPVYQLNDDIKVVRPTLDARGEDDCQCQYHSPCLHKAVLSCLLPESLNEALSSIETIRQQLKRTRLRRGRPKQ